MTTPAPLPRQVAFVDESTQAPDLAAPQDLVRKYVELTRKRRDLEDQLAYLRAELELVASQMLTKDAPRGRFRAGESSILARLQPSCVFDKQTVARELQKAGRLADVATISGPGLARFLANEPVLSARLADHIRFRNAVVLMAAQD